MALKKNTEEIEIPSLNPDDCFQFAEDYVSIKLAVEWTSKENGISADLDLNLYCYDERARLVEKVNKTHPISKDESFFFLNDLEGNVQMANSHVEVIKFNFRLVSSATVAVVLYLDGGPRNFQFLQSVNVNCIKGSPDRNFGAFLPEAKTGSKGLPTFKIFGRTRKNYQGIVLCALYKDGWHNADTPQWTCRSFLEPLFVSTEKAKDDKCNQLTVHAVPALDRFRPRLFSSIREICAALSSHSLPKLKKKFQKSENGLPIGQFTEVIFKQLYETHPKIIDESESAYAVAMLQEMFYQIDYNGDSTTNWDEFTTFCVQTGVGSSGNNSANIQRAPNVGDGANGKQDFSLDQYVIEYGEEMLHRDHVLSAYRFVSIMHHIPTLRKILVISEDADNILILDEKFRLYSQIYPSKVQVVGTIATGPKAPETSSSNTHIDSAGKTTVVHRPVIYDVCYLMKRDLYAYCSSDHSITVCKEYSSLGGKKMSYVQHNRFYHGLLHLKLCWSAKQDLLCSAASDRTIYGWNIDTANIIFQIHRHSDNITDFICLDNLDLFITCSMDKRIVLWSSTSRRVKGILLGHKRGVRCLSVYETTLLSAGFECEAKTWDLTLKENVAILKGHRHPVAAARLMCDRAQSEKEYRAITVDESGEFRLWNIYVREKSTEPIFVPTLQIFEMQNGESPLNSFRFLALPYNPRYSTSYYSDLIACSTKLLHFLPEKNVKEFIPPTASVFNESQSSIVTAVGKNILTYDMSNGQFSDCFQDVGKADITAICLDGDRGRRMFIGNTAGDLLLINSINGTIIDQVHYHARDVTVIRQVQSMRNCIYTCSLDGHFRVYEESGGHLIVYNSIDNAFGENVGIIAMKVAPTLHVIVAASLNKSWGMWHETSFKRMLIIQELELVTAIEIIGASRDREDIEMKLIKASRRENEKTNNDDKDEIKLNSNTDDDLEAAAAATAAAAASSQFLVEKENYLTLAVAMASGIVVYTFDVLEMRGIKSLFLSTDRFFYYTDITLIRSPDAMSVNYSSLRQLSTTSKASVTTKDSPIHINTSNSNHIQPTKTSDSYQLAAVTDDGQIILWDISKVRFQCEETYKSAFRGVPLSRRSFKSFVPRKTEVNLSRHSSVAQLETGPNHALNKTFPTSLQSEKSNRNLDTGLRRSSVLNYEKKVLSSNNVQPIPEDDQSVDSTNVSVLSANSGNASVKHGSGSRSKVKYALPSLKNKKEVNKRKVLKNKANQNDNLNLPVLDISETNLAQNKLAQKLFNIGALNVPSSSITSSANSLQGGSMGSNRRTSTDSGGSTSLVSKFQTANMTMSWIEMPSARFFAPPNNKRDLTAHIKSKYSSIGHLDSIPIVVPLQPHSCIVSVSMDGYHRIWNLDKECLGELLLPNITEQMKNASICKEAGSNWRFILERIPVKKIHIDTAAQLVKSLSHNPFDKISSPSNYDRRRANLAIKLKSNSLSESDEDNASLDETSRFRKSVLQSLLKPNSPPEDAPPNRLPTKEEKELLRLSLTQSKLEFANAGYAHGKHFDPSISVPDVETNGVLKSLASPVKHEKKNPQSAPAQLDAFRLSHSVDFSDVPKSKPNSRQTSRNSKSRTQRVRLDSRNLNSQHSHSRVSTAESKIGSISPNNSRSRSRSASPPKQQKSQLVKINHTLKHSESSPLQVKIKGPDSVSSSYPATPLNTITSPAKLNGLSLAETNNLTRSLLLKKDSSVLLSVMGGPSLWYEPGEKDIFGNHIQQTHSNVPEKKIAPAFSESSLSSGLREGILDPEGVRLLRQVASNSDKVSVYERCQPTLLLRNPTLSTTVQIPSIESIRKTEICFGAQKDMYKNAEKVLNDYNNVSKTAVRGAIAKARIDQNVRKINSMIHLIEPPSHNEVVLPKGKKNGGVERGSTLENDNDDKDEDDEISKLRSEEQKIKLRLLISAALVPSELQGTARPLDRNSINKWISKMKTATDTSNEKMKGENGQKKKKKEVLSQAAINSLEKKLLIAIRGEFRARNARQRKLMQSDVTTPTVSGNVNTPSSTRGKINTRALLPFYRLENIHQFMDIFAKVDENFSGDLDVNEWIRLFTSLDESIPVHEARMIFMKIDKDADGFLTMRELVPVVFSRATKEQQKIIIQYAEMELTKQHGENVPTISTMELTQLFEAYDVESMGFVEVSLIKDRIKAMHLNEHVLFSFMDSISDLADDEMVNHVEFLRLFKSMTGSK